MLIDILLAYASGVVIWKAGVTTWEFWELGRTENLKIRPGYPDGCGGLAPIGRLFFSLSYVLVVVGLFFSGWLVVGYIAPDFDHDFQYFAPWFKAGLIGFLVVSLSVFFLPLFTLHWVMKQAAAHQEARSGVLAGRIAELEESLLDLASTPDNEVEARCKEIESWRSIYLRQKKFPTWPVDFQTLGKFVSAQIGLWIGIPLSLVEHWEKVKPIWEHMKSHGPT